MINRQLVNPVRSFTCISHVSHWWSDCSSNEQQSPNPHPRTPRDGEGEKKNGKRERKKKEKENKTVRHLSLIVNRSQITHTWTPSVLVFFLFLFFPVPEMGVMNNSFTDCQCISDRCSFLLGLVGEILFVLQSFEKYVRLSLRRHHSWEISLPC